VFSYAYAAITSPFAVIEEELQQPIEEMYATFSDQPVAAASLGQVCEECVHVCVCVCVCALALVHVLVHVCTPNVCAVLCSYRSCM
jgi:predicted unusual protein kinase regulating ubiquinone biosynthesis (AarF/ABC1/UbiB family)